MFVNVSMPSYDSLGAAPTFGTSSSSETATPARNASTTATPNPVRALRFIMFSIRYTQAQPKEKAPWGVLLCGMPCACMLSRQERLDTGDLVGGRPIARPDHALDDAPVAVEEEALGESPDAVLPSHLAIGIVEHRKRQLHLID